MKVRDFPARMVTGGFIFHSGLEKWKGDEDTAKMVHGMAAGSFSLFNSVTPTQFLKALAVGEMALGAAIMAPFVPTGLAGVALTGFSGGLLKMYMGTPGLRKEGSIWPTPNGVGISKDSWLAAIGAGFVLEGLTPDRKKKLDKAEAKADAKVSKAEAKAAA